MQHFATPRREVPRAVPYSEADSRAGHGGRACWCWLILSSSPVLGEHEPGEEVREGNQERQQPTPKTGLQDGQEARLADEADAGVVRVGPAAGPH